jgi:hypothetical protein
MILKPFKTRGLWLSSFSLIGLNCVAGEITPPPPIRCGNAVSPGLWISPYLHRFSELY